MEDEQVSVCSDQSGDSVCSDQSTASVNFVAVRASRRRPRPHPTDLGSVTSSTKHAKLLSVSDLFGTLPDSVIQDILACLPIEDAIKTSVLSRKWRPLWKQMPTLCFKHRCFSLDLDKFVQFVDKTVDHFTGHKVENFIISFKCIESVTSFLDKWVHFAIERRVENLCLVLEGGYADAPFLGTTPYRLPHFLYQYPYFKRLALRQCIISYESYVSWNCLEVLFISHSRLKDDGTIPKILLGSPNLQKLVLRNCDGISRIMSSSLKDLALDGIHDSDEKRGCKTEIMCENLQSFSLLGFIHRRTYKIMLAPLLSTVNLGFVMKIDEGDKSDSTKHRNIVSRLVDRFCNVEKLIVQTWCIQVLSICEIKGISSLLSTRKFLELKTEVHEWELPGIMNLIKNSPYLKKLVIDICPCNISEPDFDENFSSYEFDEVKFLSSTSWIHKCFLQSLEKIEIVGFQPDWSRSNGTLVKLLVFLVKNASALKKFSIYEESGGLYQFWKSSGPNETMGNAMRNQMVLMLSDSMPENAIIL